MATMEHVVPCGRYTLRMGSSGTLEAVDGSLDRTENALENMDRVLCDATLVPNVQHETVGPHLAASPIVQQKVKSEQPMDPGDILTGPNCDRVYNISTIYSGSGGQLG